MSLLSPEKIFKALKDRKLVGWQNEETFIYKHFIFEDFKQAIDFVNKVAEISEAIQHHPDIKIQWNKVTLSIWTHSEYGITEKDIILAKNINQI